MWTVASSPTAAPLFLTCILNRGIKVLQMHHPCHNQNIVELWPGQVPGSKLQSWNYVAMRIKLFLPSCLINHVNTSLYYISTYFFALHYSTLAYQHVRPITISIDPSYLFWLVISFSSVLSHPPLPHSQLQQKNELAIQSFSVYSFIFCTYHWNVFIFSNVQIVPALILCANLLDFTHSGWLYPQWVTEIHLPMTDGYICTKHLLGCVQLPVDSEDCPLALTSVLLFKHTSCYTFLLQDLPDLGDLTATSGTLKRSFPSFRTSDRCGLDRQACSDPPHSKFTSPILTS